MNTPRTVRLFAAIAAAAVTSALMQLVVSLAEPHPNHRLQAQAAPAAAPQAIAATPAKSDRLTALQSRH